MTVSIQTAAELAAVEAHVIVVGCYQDDIHTEAFHLLNQAAAERLLQQVREDSFTGKLGETLSHYTGLANSSQLSAIRILLVGLGKPEAFDDRALRKALGKAFEAAKALKAERIAIYPDSFRQTDTAKLAQEIVVSALAIGNYRRNRKTAIGLADQEPERYFRNLIILAHPDELHHHSAQALTEGAAAGEIIGNSVHEHRNLSDQRANEITTDRFVESALAVARDSGGLITANVMDREDLVRLKMGGILAVSAGSSSINPPYLVELTYTPPTGATPRVLGLVGKTVVYDTGGLSIKPNDGMVQMFRDKTGGVACLMAIQALAKLKAPISLKAYFPVVDNVISGTSFRPGDVITMYGGKTVENLNSDAEGRLILADAITYAQEQGVTDIVDVATLTGAARIVAGNAAALLFGNEPDLVDAVLASADRTGENLQLLRMFPEIEEYLKSSYADFANIDSSQAKGAGATVAAWFLRKFVNERTRWVHLDIASVSWNEHGATGFIVKTLIQLGLNLAKSAQER